MRDFIRILKRFVPPYKKYMVLNIVFNVLSAILNLFSFALIIPILQILFKMDEGNYTFMDWNFNAGSWESWKALPELIKNNFFWYVSDLIEVPDAIFSQSPVERLISSPSIMALPLPERKVSWKRNGKLVSGVCHRCYLYLLSC